MQIGIFDSVGVLRAKTDVRVGLSGTNQPKSLTFSSPVTFSGQGYIACIVTDDTSIVITGSSAAPEAILLNIDATKRAFTVPALGGVDFGTVGATTLGTRSAYNNSVPNMIVLP
jgi:hypothetical protein